MAKVTTKTGDTGLSSLLGKERVPKSDPRIALLGTVLNAVCSPKETPEELPTNGEIAYKSHRSAIYVQHPC